VRLAPCGLRRLAVDEEQVLAFRRYGHARTITP
jgi:hypothetical protein